MRTLLFRSLLLLTAVGLHAGPYLPPNALELAAAVPPPPADGSPAGEADLETVWRLQVARTDADRARVERVADQDIFSFARPILGDWFNAAQLPQTADIFHAITQDAYAVALAAKNHWKRPRPHLRDARIDPFPRRSRSAAYPSGHASDAAAWAVFLTALFPAQAAAFEEQVAESMWCRVLGGSHFPTDTHAGRTLGRAIGRAMLQTAAGQAALATVRAEIAAIRTDSLAP